MENHGKVICIMEEIKDGDVIGSMQRNAYHGNINGISPTITSACGMGGGQIPMIVEECKNTVPRFGDSRLNKMIQEGKIDTSKLLFVDTYNQSVHEDIAMTIKARVDASNQHYISEPTDDMPNEDEALNVRVATLKGYETVYPGGVFDAQYPNSTNRRSRVKDGGNVTSALTCGGTPPCYYEAKTGKRYRIRKLTERECFRLMGVDDDVIDVIQSATTDKGKQAISKSQQYKMAGNSIVVDCLYYIFENLYINAPQIQEGAQLSLFDFLD